MEKKKVLILLGLESRPLGGVFHSQTVYRLRHPDTYGRKLRELKSSRPVARLLECKLGNNIGLYYSAKATHNWEAAGCYGLLSSLLHGGRRWD
jgi:hypothetical protein